MYIIWLEQGRPCSACVYFQKLLISLRVLSVHFECICQIIIFYDIRRSKRYQMKVCIVFPESVLYVKSVWILE